MARKTVEGPEQDYLTLGEVCAYLHVSQATLRRMIRAGKFPRPVRHGGAGAPVWSWLVVVGYAALSPLLPDLFALPLSERSPRPSKDDRAK